MNYLPSIVTSLRLFVVSFFIVMILGGCSDSEHSAFHFQFDSKKQVSGKKWAIRDISPDLPADWSPYNYVVLEYKISTAQRFNVGFTTDAGYNELRVMSYVPSEWSKLAIPLRFYTRLPDPNNDIAGTLNQPRYTGWVNLGVGTRGPLTGVDSIGIRMQVPIGDPTFEIRSISLAKEDPGDEYLGETPVVDAFGQSNLVDFEGKISSLEQLKNAWNTEAAILAEPTEVRYATFGGYLDKQVEATGFFRTEEIDGKWWFVDPEGYLFLSLGADCVGPGRGGHVNRLDRRNNFLQTPPPKGKGLMGDELSRVSYGEWNLFRRFGEDYPKKSREMIVDRMGQWGLNTIPNWSSRSVIDMNQKAFMLQLQNLGIGEGIMGLSDVYAEGFAQRIDQACAEFVAPYRDNPWLNGYFTGNEPSWLGQESRLCDLILAAPDDMPMKAALQQYLAEGDSSERRKAFILDAFRTFLITVKNSLKKHDPNHLSL